MKGTRYHFSWGGDSCCGEKKRMCCFITMREIIIAIHIRWYNIRGYMDVPPSCVWMRAMETIGDSFHHVISSLISVGARLKWSSVRSKLIRPKSRYGIRSSVIPSGVGCRWTVRTITNISLSTASRKDGIPGKTYWEATSSPSWRGWTYILTTTCNVRLRSSRNRGRWKQECETDVFRCPVQVERSHCPISSDSAKRKHRLRNDNNYKI